MGRFRFGTIVTASLLLASATTARAAEDHLKCFKIKDAMAKSSYTADITPAHSAFDAVPPGCTITVPAKLLCVDASKTNVVPVPPGAPDGAAIQPFLCYKVKCAKAQPTATVTDQFGSHDIVVKTSSLLCAPADVVLPTTTTTMPVCVPAAETCNSEDDDCDGFVDEDYNVGSACMTGQVGACASGTVTCDGMGNASCVPGTSPSAEQCNNVDDDCNGMTDEGLGGEACSTGLLGPCDSGVSMCSGGMSGCSQVVFPTSETCNGSDDDCNGIVDDGTGGGMCSTGFAGVCAFGTQSCAGGMASCTANVTPGTQAESCDGQDNNCNGTVDEGNPGGGSACSTGFPGICSSGTTNCTGGSLQCTAAVSPGTQAEACNGVDDDCDGQVDEGGVCP